MPLLHGFTHLFFWHALSWGQSELKTHSGRHSMYGFPWNSGRHEHSPLLHSAFGPHGVGLHGSTSSRSVISRFFKYKYSTCQGNIFYFYYFARGKLTWFNEFTFCESITSIIWKTGTDRHIFIYSTLSV